jgi:hypothetical protein
MKNQNVIVQVKTFSDYDNNNLDDVNLFLKELNSDTRVISVTPLYNTILGGMMYVVVYYA